MRGVHSRPVLLALAGAGLAATISLAQARAAPTPPPRPSSLSPSRATPPSRRTPTKPVRPLPAPTAPDEGAASQTQRTLPPIDPDHPPLLPAASREKMRVCGREWEAMKMAGKDEGGWRAFATQCLTH